MLLSYLHQVWIPSSYSYRSSSSSPPTLLILHFLLALSPPALATSPSLPTSPLPSFSLSTKPSTPPPPSPPPPSSSGSTAVPAAPPFKPTSSRLAPISSPTTTQPSTPNPSSWNRRFGLLFIDNPLGAGFSTAPSNADIPGDQPTVARHLFAALQSFLSSNPSFRTRPLFLTGFSYAGKYISTVGYHILQNNPHLPVSDRINLAGVAIGNGAIHPIVHIIMADVAYYAGLINDRQRTHLESLQYEAVRLMVAGDWSAANDANFATWSWLENATGLATLGDVTRLTADNYTMVGVFLNKEEVKEALGVRNEVVWEQCNEAVSRALQNEAMKSVKFELEYLVENSRVLVYQGIYDLLCGVVSTEAWIKEMEWEGLESFMSAERRVWKKDGLRAGYVQRWGRFSQVVVSGAGHNAAADQKPNTQAMIEDWVLEQGLFVS